MFNKLKQQFNQITKKKAILDEFEDKVDLLYFFCLQNFLAYNYFRVLI